MADEDKESKTEEASEKKVSDALEKGNVPFSREASLFASMLGVLVVLAFFIGQKMAELTGVLGRFLDDPAGFRLESAGDATALLWMVGGATGRFLLPIIVILAIAGVAAAVFQNAPRFVGDRIRPKWNRVSPASGAQRIFGPQGIIEFAKSFFKFALVIFVVLVLLHADQYEAINAMFTDPSLLPGLILSMATRLVSAVCVGTIVLVAGDLVWSRLKWRRDLMMSRQEQKEEHKQAEGDPMVKARLRSLAKARARQRMLTDVPNATVIVTNPTHYAIGLRYDRDRGGAPQVVAKGADLVALRIREIATLHGVPIIEDRALARAMYDAVDVGQWIPPEFYRAVAKILYFVYSRESRDVTR
ncbi:flagellar biosynthesis protein FlhB [Segnochrobactrum spirostomi]|uniref:Flagellar biosynthetic protein FlhB n=1 Tax=Segnochrobactrum spirostomi TaxID=2608987 RepID=A0A6A7Y1E3_9HYPH|nr:flagellar biosynthesis protein FlhB [Segnochrobactrum spirostomi]MQT12753.1 flagellar biosynthesis protein FlhB [Segnochrobactrum spirostomi]